MALQLWLSGLFVEDLEGLDQTLKQDRFLGQPPTFFDLPQIKAEIVSTVGITLFIPINEDKFVRYRADQNSV
jgi:hypothetical protein